MQETIHMGVPGEGDLKMVHFGSMLIGGKARTFRQTDLIAEVLGVQNNVELKEELGLYLIPNHYIDLLLGTDVRTPLMIPLASRGINHPLQLPRLHLLKHEFQVGYSFSGRNALVSRCFPTTLIAFPH